MIREAIKLVEGNFTSPLSDKSNANTFGSKKKKMDKDKDSSVGDKDTETEMFTQDKTIYQRMGKKYYSQTFATEEEAWSYLSKIA